MYLIANNRIMVPNKYINEIIPAVTDLTSVTGGLFLSKIILDKDNKPIDSFKARELDDPLKRLVVMYFSDREEFDEFWNSDDRRKIWLVGKNFAYFCDSLVKDPNDLVAQNPEGVKQQSLKFLMRSGFSQREADIMYYLTLGKSNTEIARLCMISEGTVKKHLSNIYDKLGVSSRLSAVTLVNEEFKSYLSPIQLLF